MSKNQLLKLLFPKYIVFALIIILCSCVSRKNHLIATAPNIGDPMPCKEQADTMYGISSAQFSPGCEVVLNGITFFVASNETKRICYIRTSDSRFITPDGIHVGCSLKEVLDKGGTPIGAETGWAFYSELPSGWYAQFAGFPSDTTTPYFDPSSKVSAVFKKR